jgi:hypothetical protein
LVYVPRTVHGCHTAITPLRQTSGCAMHYTGCGCGVHGR